MLTRPRIGVIGTGAMGGAIANRLLDQGYAVATADIDPVAQDRMASVGAEVFDTASAVAAISDVVFIVVVDSAQIETVLSAPSGLISPGLVDRTVLLCSTIDPEDTRAFATRIDAAGGATLDTPMSGGPAAASDGDMSMMIAGPPATVVAVQPVLDAVSSAQFRISQRLGDAARAKLLNNLAAGINLVAAVESVALAGHLGLDPAIMHGVLSASSGKSWIGDDRIPRALSDDLNPRAAMSLLTKDLTLAIAMVEREGLTSTLGTAALARFVDACQAGLVDLDDAALYRHLTAELLRQRQ